MEIEFEYEGGIPVPNTVITMNYTDSFGNNGQEYLELIPIEDTPRPSVEVNHRKGNKALQPTPKNGMAES